MFLLPLFSSWIPPPNPFQFSEDRNTEDWFIPRLFKAGTCLPCNRADMAFSSPDYAHHLALQRIPLPQTQSAHKGVEFGGCGDGLLSSSILDDEQMMVCS